MKNVLLSFPERVLAVYAPAGRMRRYWHLALYGGTALLLLVLLTIARRADMSFGVFTQDPLALTKGKPYFGLLSNIGILFWCATTTACLFVSTLVQKNRRFFIMSGLFTLLLLLDDLFLLHEEVLPQGFGIRQRYVLLVYLMITLLYLTGFRIFIRRHYPAIIIGALAFFGLSLAEDLLFLAPEDWHYLVEDGAKLFGIITWFNYFLLVCREEVTPCTCRHPR